MAILPEGFFDMADRGLVRFKRASTGWCFSENGVVLDDGTKVAADLVFLATGFEGTDKLREVLPKPFRDLVVGKSSMMPLYRYVYTLRLSFLLQHTYMNRSTLTCNLFWQWHDPPADPQHGVRGVRGERVEPAHIRAAMPMASGAAGGAVRAAEREGHDGARRRRGRRHAPHHRRPELRSSLDLPDRLPTGLPPPRRRRPRPPPRAPLPWTLHPSVSAIPISLSPRRRGCRSPHEHTLTRRRPSPVRGHAPALSRRGHRPSWLQRVRTARARPRLLPRAPARFGTRACRHRPRSPPKPLLLGNVAEN